MRILRVYVGGAVAVCLLVWIAYFGQSFKFLNSEAKIAPVGFFIFLSIAAPIAYLLWMFVWDMARKSLQQPEQES